jgi:hypothetical protein
MWAATATAMLRVTREGGSRDWIIKAGGGRCQLKGGTSKPRAVAESWTMKRRCCASKEGDLAGGGCDCGSGGDVEAECRSMGIPSVLGSCVRANPF